jgi:hypothetical protein
LARLPSRLDLSGPGSFRTGRSYSSADTSAVGRGLANLGANISQAGDAVFQEATAISDQRRKESIIADLPPVDAAFRTAVLDYERELETDTEFDKVGTRFDTWFNQNVNQYAKGITDEKARAEWVNDARAWGVGRLASIKDGATRRAREKQTVNVATALDQYSNIYVDPRTSPEERERTRATISATIDAAEKNGQIDASTAYSWRKKNLDQAELTFAKLWAEQNPTTVAAGAGTISGRFVSKIIGAESGGDPDAKNPKSSASGLGQFIDSTWVQMLDKTRPEMAGLSYQEKIALKSDSDLSRELTEAYARQNQAALEAKGLPVTEGTLYLSHFAGEAGAAKVLKADPSTDLLTVLGADVIRANPFLKGKDAAWLISWADKKMGQARSSAAPPNYDRLSPEDRYEYDKFAEQKARQHITELELNNKQALLTQKFTIETAATNAPAAIQSNGTYTGPMPAATDFNAVYGEQEGPQRYAAFQSSLQTSQDVYSMQAKSASEIASMLEAAKPVDTGAGAAVQSARYETLQRAADAVIKAREADPAAYAQRSFPSVRQAWEGVSSGNVTTTDAIRQTVAAQEQLGIPAGKIAPLPKDFVGSAVAKFSDVNLPEADRANAITGALFATTDVNQQRAILRQMVDAGLPEYVEGALSAVARNDQGAARRLMQAALIDPAKLPGKIAATNNEIEDAIQVNLLDENGVADVYYGLSSGMAENFNRALADKTLLTRAVQMRVMQGEDVNTAAANAGKDLFGDVQVVLGDGDVNAQILLPSDADPEPLIAGMRVAQGEVAETLKQVMAAQTGSLSMTDGTKAVVDSAALNRIEDIVSEGYFVEVNGGFGFLDPYTGGLVPGLDGKPLMFTADGLIAKGGAPVVPKEKTLTDIQRKASEATQPMVLPQ